MSRIQHILDKAEREGAVRRVRTETAIAGTPEAPPMVASPGRVMTPVSDLRPTASAAAAAPAPVTPSRIVANARLDPRLVTPASTDAVAAEQYRALRTRILHADPAISTQVVLVTSPGRGEGRTLTAGNLGLAMAQEWQRRICIVDADLRHPQMHRIFGLPDGAGLCDVLTGQSTLDDALLTLEEHQITILPAGNVPAHPAELLGTTAMRRLLDSLRSQFDRVVVDATSATPLADVSILAPLVDRVLVVVRAGVTTKPAIHDALAGIDSTKLLGLVLNEAA